MQKFILLLLILTSIISGCTPQVTAPLEATATLLPATQTPEPTATPTVVYTPIPAQEIITTPRGLEILIGDQTAGQDDAFLIEDIKNGKGMVSLDGDTLLGFKPEDNQWVYIKGEGESYRVVLQRISDGTVIGELKSTGNIIWDWRELVDENRENILFNSAKVLDGKNIQTTYRGMEQKMVEYAYHELKNGDEELTFLSRAVYSNDNTKAFVVVTLKIEEGNDTSFVCIMGKDLKPFIIYVEHFDFNLPRI